MNNVLLSLASAELFSGLGKSFCGISKRIKLHFLALSTLRYKRSLSLKFHKCWVPGPYKYQILPIGGWKLFIPFGNLIWLFENNRELRLIITFYVDLDVLFISWITSWFHSFLHLIPIHRSAIVSNCLLSNFASVFSI